MALHPATQQILRFFVCDHLPDGPIQTMGIRFANLVDDLHDYLVTEEINDPEVTTGFRKLLEAKDCFVRAVVAHEADNSGE